MPKVPLPATVLEAEIERYLAAPSDDPTDVRQVAARFRVLPLLSDFMGCWALAVSGDVVFVSWDDPTCLEPVSDHPVDRVGLHVALARGASRYPTLGAIHPQRGADAVPCTTCDGSGRRPEWPSNVVCVCGGMGWTPPAWE